MQEKFLKYISLQPQYIPYARRGPGREPGALRYLWKMFLTHTGILIKGLSYLTAGRNLGENAKCCCKGGIQTARGLRAALIARGLRLRASELREKAGSGRGPPTPPQGLAVQPQEVRWPSLSLFPICNTKANSTPRILLAIEAPSLRPSWICAFLPWVAEETASQLVAGAALKSKESMGPVGAPLSRSKGEQEASLWSAKETLNPDDFQS